MKITTIIAYTLVIIGGLVWLLIGLFDFNLVSTVFSGARAVGSIITYSIIAIAALWLIISPMMTDGVLWLRDKRAR